MNCGKSSNMQEIKKSNILVNLRDYNDAMKICIHDDDWLNLAFIQKENVIEVAKDICPNPTGAVLKYLADNNIRHIINNKNTVGMDEKSLAFFFEQQAEQTKIDLIKLIQEKTKYFANIAANLLQEYSQNQRDFFEAQLTPFPEAITDTTKPINKFKIEINENAKFYIVLHDSQVYIASDNSHTNEIKNYFAKRNQNKNIIRGYLGEKELNEQSYHALRRNLAFVKETVCKTTVLYEKNNLYKCIFLENQVVKIEDEYKPLNGCSIKIKNILRTTHE